MFDHFDLIARYYDRIFQFLDTERLLSLLALEPDHLLLDVGGGTGRVSATIADRCHVLICDPSRQMAAMARAKGLDAVRCTAEYLPLSDASVDRILIVDAFHHFADQHQAAGELLRVLRPGGRLVIEEPDIRRPAIKLVALGEKLLLMRSHFFKLEELQALFQAAGGRLLTSEADQINIRLVITI